MFRQQLRAILRASAYGRVRILIPMVAHLSEVKLTFEALARARQQLDDAGQPHAPRRGRRDDRGAGGGAEPVAVPAPLRLRVDRHQRPDPVHVGDRSRRRGRVASLRPLASGRHRIDREGDRQGRARERASACAARWRAILPSRNCCWPWGCAASRCTRRRSRRSSSASCAPTRDACRGPLRGSFRPTIRSLKPRRHSARQAIELIVCNRHVSGEQANGTKQSSWVAAIEKCGKARRLRSWSKVR